MLLALVLLGGTARGAGPDPQSAIGGFEKRVEAIFRAEAGKPLVRARKESPISKGRPDYTREYSYSIVAFAARCYHLGEMLAEADEAIRENAQHYLDHPAGIHDRDSFQWHAEIVMRLIEMYGSKGCVHAGRMSEATEKLALEPIWQYASQAWLEKAACDEKSIWQQYGSENHHAMDFTVNWHFAKLAKDRAEYRDRKYKDGSTAAQQSKAWDDYVIAYCRARGRKSLCSEMRSDGYNTTLIKGFYNFYDFGKPEVRQAAGLFLDLYFAYWAEEQIDGHMGGGASRLKGNNAFVMSRQGKNAALAWYYFGIGKAQDHLSGHDIGALTSSYRPPLVVADIALDAEGRGTYEIRQRAQGLVVPGGQGSSFTIATAKEPPTRMRNDGGGIVRYSYCTPQFILGTPMVEARPNADWAAISAQSRWQGAIFAREGDPRVVPLVRASDNRVVFNGFWSVQSKGTLITQKLKGNKGGAEMIVFISERGLPEPVEKGDVVFVDAQSAYAAIRVPVGGWEWRVGGLDYTAETGGLRKGPPGRVMQLKQD
ncbi:MAG TPA: hypothetical protein VFY13_00085, partial [Luteolibacter sp.]|nr:hypothetical protein [Luteolibacter sp.]